LYNDTDSMKNRVLDERIVNVLGAVGGMKIDGGS
jgi:hypothetical protein